jgi:hypothetical protein
MKKVIKMNVQFYNYKTSVINSKSGETQLFSLAKILSQINEKNEVKINSHKIVKDPETISFLQQFTQEPINIEKIHVPEVIEYSKTDSTYYVSGQFLQFILLHYDVSFANYTTAFLETLRNIYNNRFTSIIEHCDLDLLQDTLYFIAPETIVKEIKNAMNELGEEF